MKTDNCYDILMKEHLEAFNVFLNSHFDTFNCPEPLLSSMKYSLSNGGKRLRPVLFRLSHTKYSHLTKDAGLFSLAIESIHTYSLIHDDLPVIDNDDIRRGKPSNHKVFGEDIALLAGDGLLNYAYELIADILYRNNSGEFIKAFCELSRYAGINGMIGGQIKDVVAEKQRISDAEVLQYIHVNKTAGLITASLVSGALIGGAPEKDIESLRDYGLNLGMLFQITDDLLDVTGNTAVLGKTTGKDTEKLTYPNLFGINKTIEKANEYHEKAISALKNIPDAGIFRHICDKVIIRDY